MVSQLCGLMGKRGRNLHAGQAGAWTEDAWTEEWFNGNGLRRLCGTVRYPGQRNHARKVIGKSRAGNRRRGLKGDGGNEPVQALRP